jgi:predicted restriction endonuclease
MHGMQINLPEDENYYPHQEALDWHKKEVFNKFSIS